MVKQQCSGQQVKIASRLQPEHVHLTLERCLALPTAGRTPLAFLWSGPSASALAASACAASLGSEDIHHVGLLSASQRIRPTPKQAGGSRGVYCCPGSGENATRPSTCRSPIFCTHLFWSSVKLQVPSSEWQSSRGLRLALGADALALGVSGQHSRVCTCAL